jgi:hypothetical protein
MAEQKRSVPSVFISSTAEDLRPYRAAVRDAAISSALLPVMSEYFVAAGESPPWLSA